MMYLRCMYVCMYVCIQTSSMKQRIKRKQAYICGNLQMIKNKNYQKKKLNI